jgi:DNA-binding beta-propeller fold protein YncE
MADAAPGGSGGTGGTTPAPDGRAPMIDAAPSGPATIVLVAGGGNGGDGMPATMAALAQPYGAVVDPVNGEVYIAEVNNGKVRRIDAGGIISTVVGAGAQGAAANIKLNQPHDLLFQPGTRNLFIADTMNGGVFRYNAETGEIAQFAGGGAPFPGGGTIYCLAATADQVYYTTAASIRVADLKTMTQKPAIPYGGARVIAVDSKGTLYAVKNGGNVLQTVDAAGKTTDMPGTAGVINAPKHIAIDPEDNVLIADTEKGFIRKYLVASKMLVTIAGTGAVGTGMLGGPPEKAQVARPHGIFADSSGVIYISDSENNRVLKITH